MKDYSKIVKALRQCAENKCEGCAYAGIGACEEVIKEDAADAIEELKATVSKQECEKMALYRDTIFAKKRIEYLESQIPHWISVEDRMPKPYEYVLVWGGEYAFVDSWWDNAWASQLIADTNITHWMPLPEPPKE